MNLYHFEEAVSRIIVQRGFAYYEEGCIAELRREGGGRYRAFVEGTDMYEIEVRIDDQGNILSTYCDCPYDMGPVCKHEVAVYYELIDKL